MKKYLLYSALVINIVMYADVREYAEDAFFMPADQSLSDYVDSVAQLNNFTLPYEIVIPKKPALQMSVWNRCLGFSKNPISSNPYIVINPPWFSTLTTQEQQAMLSLNFQSLNDTTYSYFTRFYLPYIQTLIGVIMIFLIMTLIGRIGYFMQRPRYYGIIAAVLINGALQHTVVKKSLDCFNNMITTSYAHKFMRRVLEITHNKQAMISAYEKQLLFVEQSIKDGEKNLEVFADKYAQRIKWLKNQQQPTRNSIK